MNGNGNKVIVLGIDGMDPRFTKWMLDEGRLPNIKKMLDRGAAREDLVMLGGVPTITPPMWTTLSTGAYPMTHGITCFWNTDGDRIARLANNFRSYRIKAEQIWQVTTEAGKKTLVWTWPCSWPPISDNPLLHVAGGTGPTFPANGNVHADGELLVYGSVDYDTIESMNKVDLKGGAGCIVTDDMLGTAEVNDDDDDDKQTRSGYMDNPTGNQDTTVAWTALTEEEGEEACEWEYCLPRFQSPIKEPNKWGFDVPEGAKELIIVAKGGLVRYPALILKNEAGEYDRVDLYFSKKDEKPFVSMKEGEFYPLVFTKLPINDEKTVMTTRFFSIVKIDHTGNSVVIALGPAYDIESDTKTELYSPKSLYQQVVDIAGYEPSMTSIAGSYPELVSQRILPSYHAATKWQAKVLLGLIKENQYEAVFTHLHSCDHLAHACWRWAKHREKYGPNHDEKIYQGFLEEIYLQADEYIGEFLPLLDEGWAIIVTSDHGLLCSQEDEVPMIGDAFAMNVRVMEELGYTVMKKDENGEDTHDIDWSKTKAVAPRGDHIYINLKGRNPKGIVDPADKYELERQIIDDLYNYRFDGKRVISLALRNKDAKLLGMGGPECGDIIYFIEEGFCRLHGDTLSTTEGYFHTSVSPIFFSAGAGLKKGCKTERVIREVDVAPTVAAIMGLRMPAQCEGAPVYQILDKEYMA